MITPDLGETQREYAKTTSMKGEEKRQALLGIMRKIQDFERQAAMNFSIPFDVVKGWKELLGQVAPAVTRLQVRRKVA